MTAIAAPGSTVLRMVGNRMGVLNIEVETGWHPDRIRELAEEEGYSFEASTGRFFRASHISAGTGEASDSTDAHEAAAQPPAVPAVQIVTGTGGAPNPMPAVPLAPVPVSPVTRDLIVEGEASSVDRIRRAAARARKAVDELSVLLDRQAIDEARKAKEAADKAAAAKRVADLKKQLADAVKAKDALGRNRVVVNANSPTMRAWAAENGVACPARGKVPRSVIEAYQDAHEDVAS